MAQGDQLLRRVWTYSGNWSSIWGNAQYQEEWFFLVGMMFALSLALFCLAILLAAARVKNSWQEDRSDSPRLRALRKTLADLAPQEGSE